MINKTEQHLTTGILLLGAAIFLIWGIFGASILGAVVGFILLIVGVLRLKCFWFQEFQDIFYSVFVRCFSCNNNQME